MQTENKTKGFTASIYRSDFIDSLAKFKGLNNVTIIHPELPQLSAPDEKYPAVKIVKRTFSTGDYYHAEPIEAGSYAFSGSFIYTSDSRFSELFKYPVPLHDRQMDLEVRTNY